MKKTGSNLIAAFVWFLLICSSVTAQTQSRTATIEAPNVCENGSVCPLSVLFNPPLSIGEYFQISLNDAVSVTSTIIQGELNTFSYRIMLDRQINVLSVDCPKCQPTTKQIRAILTAKRSPSTVNSEPRDLRIRATKGDIRILVSAIDVMGGRAILDGEGLIIKTNFDQTIAPNPFFGFKGSIRGENSCFLIEFVGGKISQWLQQHSELHCTGTRRAISAEANYFWALPPATEINRAVKNAFEKNWTLRLGSSVPDADGILNIEVVANTEITSLKVNGDEEGPRADGRYLIKRFAVVGENKFEIVATDRFGNKEKKLIDINRNTADSKLRHAALDPTRVPVGKPRDAVAVIIGIEKYRKVPKAEFANQDASVFYDYARRALGIRQENIRLLVDDKADAAEILKTFRNWLPTVAIKGETEVFVFYSGHGLPSEDGSSLYFLPHEVDRDLVSRTAISQQELVEAIQRVSPRSVTMFIDSCYSGQSRSGETLLASARPIAVKAKAGSYPSGFTVISAAAPDQLALSSPELKHGIFSYYLMKAMEGDADKNKDGQITVGELKNYLDESVSRTASAQGRTQQPQIVGDQNRVLVTR